MEFYVPHTKEILDSENNSGDIYIHREAGERVICLDLLDHFIDLVDAETLNSQLSELRDELGKVLDAPADTCEGCGKSTGTIVREDGRFCVSCFKDTMNESLHEHFRDICGKPLYQDDRLIGICTNAKDCDSNHQFGKAQPVVFDELDKAVDHLCVIPTVRAFSSVPLDSPPDDGISMGNRRLQERVEFLRQHVNIVQEYPTKTDPERKTPEGFSYTANGLCQPALLVFEHVLKNLPGTSFMRMVVDRGTCSLEFRRDDNLLLYSYMPFELKVEDEQLPPDVDTTFVYHQFKQIHPFHSAIVKWTGPELNPDPKPEPQTLPA